MSMMPPKKVEGEQVAAPQTSKISITLSSTNPKALERVCSDLIDLAKKKRVRAKGPIRMPNRVLRITTRKSPCGEGTNTWDRFEMRIHKRVIHILSTQDFLKDMNSISIEMGVDVEVTMNKKEEKTN
ncbi:40S ribosomal protein S20 [Heterostelium album PN500]|uniref:Small ribosomal subunit protein uS10 n=1 Tax=Heterostelium pallidum (strain ATCC 26659 / Pp 5 / PN500) TaxID=670386 RepID=D3B9Y5_HETP5|nr:40S ribosomal protein S20 [Heterostelium album PN500]EFA81372.1 40S ribosomal protein S20 [Heterostelium album PN500]|eukprot:XP_020433490.1 40S ribosomal protein S20 [Heterostelium album PN500]